MNKQAALVSLLSFACASAGWADPTPARTLTHLKSPCMVTTTADEYPTYRVKKGKRVIYAPTSDGISGAIFSGSGRWIALAGSAVNAIDVGNSGFDVAVVDCEKETVKGYRIQRADDRPFEG